MNKAPIVVLLLGLAIPAPAQYVRVSLGGNASESVTIESRSDDRASICDEYINPMSVAIPECTTPDRGVGDGWLAPFSSGHGFSGEVEIGHEFARNFSLAVAYSNNATRFNQTVSSTDATGVDFDKISNELAIGEETLGTVESQELFLFGLLEWNKHDKWILYGGAGIGVARKSMDFSWVWARSASATDIATGTDQPNADEIRQNLAGTVSVGQRSIRDMQLGYSLVVGVERILTDAVSIGIKAQWKRFEEFESGAYSGDLLRSHVPNLRLDGSEPVSTWSSTKNTGSGALVFTTRFRFLRTQR